MKSPILKNLIILILITALALPVFTQTSPSTIVGKNETVAFLIRQNENAREVIKTQDARIADLENELAAERENSASIGKSYEAAKSEISSLKTSNEALSRAVSINESTIALLSADNAKQKEKAKRANRDKWKAIAVAAGVIALKFIIP
jgi:cell shape-determining protein MreC